MDNLTGLSPKEYERIKAIIAKHSHIIDQARKQLACNFDVPAQRIINDACQRMGIDRIDWEKIECVRNDWEYEAPPAHLLKRWMSY